METNQKYAQEEANMRSQNLMKGAYGMRKTGELSQPTKFGSKMLFPKKKDEISSPPTQASFTSNQSNSFMSIFRQKSIQ